MEYVLGEYSRVLFGPPGDLSAMAAAARPRGRAVALVLLCAGAYVSGAAGSNACPAGSMRIETEAACRTAAAAAGITPSPLFVGFYSDVPRGCFYGSHASFNTHAVGAGSSGFLLLCAALATTGAPLHAPMRRRACAARCSRAVGLIIQTA